MIYLFSYDYYRFFYNIDDSLFYRLNRRSKEWCVEEHSVWYISSQITYVYEIPENDIFYDGSSWKLLSDICNEYKEKLIFDKL